MILGATILKKIPSTPIHKCSFISLQLEGVLWRKGIEAMYFVY